MPIAKAKLIAMVSEGTMSWDDVGASLGVSVKTIANWKTDERGRVRSRHVLDAAIAAMVRKHWKARKMGHDAWKVSAHDMEELLSLEGCDERAG